MQHIKKGDSRCESPPRDGGVLPTSDGRRALRARRFVASCLIDTAQLCRLFERATRSPRLKRRLGGGLHTQIAWRFRGHGPYWRYYRLREQVCNNLPHQFPCFQLAFIPVPVHLCLLWLMVVLEEPCSIKPPIKYLSTYNHLFLVKK